MVNSTTQRILGLILVAALSTPILSACSGNQNRDVSTQPDQGVNQPRAKGLSTGRKVAVLLGAAALYYMLKKNQDQRQMGQAVPQYYLSKNGKVYYREPGGAVHWVNPPTSGLTVPESEAQAYNADSFKGYNGRSSGRELSQVGNKEWF